VLKVNRVQRALRVFKERPVLRASRESKAQLVHRAMLAHRDFKGNRVQWEPLVPQVQTGRMDGMGS
jgi:hypothetical protein